MVAQEWLGTLGSSELAVRIVFRRASRGRRCFGSTAGTNVKASVCGRSTADKVISLTRGLLSSLGDIQHSGVVSWSAQHVAK